MSGFPLYDLGGEDGLWECPCSVVPLFVWESIDLFFLCYTRVPGFSGWGLQRTAYPQEGTPYEQDNWTMWAFSAIEQEFYKLQSEQQEENKRAQELNKMHQQTLRQG